MGCATRLQQAGYIVQSGFRSNPCYIACLLVVLEKFRFTEETMDATKYDLEPLRLRSTSRCATRGLCFHHTFLLYVGGHSIIRGSTYAKISDEFP